MAEEIKPLLRHCPQGRVWQGVKQLPGTGNFCRVISAGSGRARAFINGLLSGEGGGKEGDVQKMTWHDSWLLDGDMKNDLPNAIQANERGAGHRTEPTT